jgi:hypothetical protein
MLASNFAYASTYDLSNEKLSITFDDETSSLTIYDKMSEAKMTSTELFIITMPNEDKLHTKDFKITGVKEHGDSISINYVNKDFEIVANVSSVKKKYASIDYTVKAIGKDRNVAKITFFATKGQTQAPFVNGSINSSPIIADSFFMLPRKPIVNTYAYEARTNLNVKLATPISVEAPVTFIVYFGTFTENSQLRRNFSEFIENMRPRSYKPYLHYNTWMDIGFFDTYTQKSVTDRMDEYKNELVKMRGVVLDGFLLDDGWDDMTGLWNFGEAFKDGFSAVKDKADSMNTSVGLWLSPWGGYNKPLAVRVSHAEELNFETVDGKFALSGPNYFSNFTSKIVNLIENEHITSFKLDGMGNADSHIKGSKFASDFDASVQLIDNMRGANSDLFINLTTGTDASPSWLFYADSIWRQGDDVNLFGDGSNVQQWITYRDAETYRSIVQKGPLFPLNSVMLHGIISAENAYYGLEKIQTDSDFSDQVWSFFASGTQLQELYITPDMLNEKKWDNLAKAAKWSRANSDVLVDTHWIGGNPTKMEVYGWASWNRIKAIFSLRNPSDKVQTYYLDLDKDFELPSDIDAKFSLKMIYGNNNTIPATYSKALVITLQPLGTIVVDAKPK